MKNLKLLYSLLVVLGAGFFASCTNDNAYAPGEVPAGPQVYWDQTNSTSVEFAGAVEEANQTLTLSRVVTDEELTIAIIADIAEGAEFFDIPETVTFEQGKATTKLEYVVDFEKFENDKQYSIIFKVMDSVATPYGCSDWTVTYALNPWELVKGGKGLFRGADVITTFFNADAAAEIEVDIYEHKNISGLYKVEDPWLSTFVAAFGYSSKDEALADDIVYTKTDLIINCENRNKCYISAQGIGIDVGYGEIRIWSDYDPVEYPDGIAGVLADGVLTWAANGIYVSMVNYQSGKWYPANSGGMFRLIWPGVELADYSLAAAYDGMDVSADSKTISAKLKFSYGGDVTGIKYVVVPGNIEDDHADVLSALANGTAENILEVADFAKGAGVANVKVGLEKQGHYTVVAAPADKNGALSAKDAVAVSFFFQGLGETVDTTCKLAGEMFLPSEINPEYTTLFPDQTSLFAVLVGQEIKSVSYYINKSAVVATWTDTPEALVAAYGTALQTENLEYINSEDGGVIPFSGLAENTEFTAIFVATNVYGESKTIVLTKKTAKYEYTGELVIGDYSMYCKYVYGEGAEDFIESENVFTVASNGGSTTDYLVTSIGIENGAVWHAKYDSAAGTLTLDGTELGYEEDYGNQFGGLYGYYDSAKTMAYGLFSYASAESYGDDPLVLAVDATTKQVSGLTTPLFSVEIYQMAEGYPFLGYYSYFVSELTTIAPYTAASTASVKSVKKQSVVPFRNAKGVRSFSAPKSKFGVNIKAGAVLNTSSKSVKTVKPTFVENYTPVKTKGVQLKTNIKAIAR